MESLWDSKLISHRWLSFIQCPNTCPFTSIQCLPPMSPIYLLSLHSLPLWLTLFSFYSLFPKPLKLFWHHGLKYWAYSAHHITSFQHPSCTEIISNYHCNSSPFSVLTTLSLHHTCVRQSWPSFLLSLARPNLMKLIILWPRIISYNSYNILYKYFYVPIMNVIILSLSLWLISLSRIPGYSSYLKANIMTSFS